MERGIKRPRSPASHGPATPDSTKIYKSNPIEDRSSTFIAYYSPSLPSTALQTHPAFQHATHRIAAWRKPSSQRTLNPSSQQLYNVGHDDDGERYAGKRLEKVLETMNVQGAIVIGRWYGGTLLGPVRFQHIEDCAREAINMWKKDTGHGDSQESKKRKTSQGAEESSRLSQQLTERDENIVVLRNLLEAKRKGEQSEEKDVADTTANTPSKKTDYSSMPLERLRQLEKARDATIFWLLKEIAKAEKALASPAERPEATTVPGLGNDANGAQSDPG